MYHSIFFSQGQYLHVWSVFEVLPDTVCLQSGAMSMR